VRCVPNIVFCGISALVVLGSVSFASAQCDVDKRTEHQQVLVKTMNSPFAFRPLDHTIHAVKGTDGLIHLAYVAQVTNATPEGGTKFRAEPVDPDRGLAPTGRNFVKLDVGANITGLIRRFAAPSAVPNDPQLDPDDLPIGSVLFSRGLPRGESGVMFFDVTYKDPEEVPARLAHRLTVDLNENGSLQHTAITLPVDVDCNQPVVLQSPLEGSGWLDANGCCAIVDGHRFAVLHLNGGIFPSQQFAIDWMQLDHNGECCNGRDPLKLESWPFFGVPIHAAASGTVVKVFGRDFPDQVPAHPVGISYENIAGNGMIEDIGHGRYIEYAHMKMGSIPPGIKVGTHIEVGEQIGLLGNSGNTGAPHLHFQVMDAPSELVANGLPFVMDNLAVEGRLIGEEADVVDGYLGGKPVHLDTGENGAQTERMPISSTVYRFNGPKP
jgi:Peptidase family M23